MFQLRITTINGFKYFTKDKIFGFYKNTENVKGLKVIHPNMDVNTIKLSFL